jgi:hypothetical protein
MAYEEERFDLKSISDIMVAMQEKQKAAEQNIEDWARLNTVLKNVLAPIDGHEDFEGIKINEAPNGPVSARRDWIEAMTNSVTSAGYDQSMAAYDAMPYNVDGKPYYAEHADIDYDLSEPSMEELAQLKLDGLNDLADIAYDVNADSAPNIEAYANRLEFIIEDGHQDLDGNADLREIMADIDNVNHQMRTHAILETRDKMAHEELNNLRDQGIVIQNYDYSDDSKTKQETAEIPF